MGFRDDPLLTSGAALRQPATESWRHSVSLMNQESLDDLVDSIFYAEIDCLI